MKRETEITANEIAMDFFGALATGDSPSGRATSCGKCLALKLVKACGL